MPNPRLEQIPLYNHSNSRRRYGDSRV
jgi:hypothetical protein